MATKINIRSPYYLKYSDTNLTKVSISLYIYEGTEGDDKGLAKYELTNDVINGTDYVVFEISEFVRDYFNFEFDGTNYSSNTQWATVEATLYNEEVILRTETANYLAFDAYTNFEDGLNAQGALNELMTTNTIIIPEGASAHIPVFSEGIVSVTLYRYATGNTNTSVWNTNTKQWQIDEDFWADEATANNNTIAEVATLSQGKIQYVEVTSDTGLVEFNSDTGSTIAVVQAQETCLYGYRKVTFINKHGAYQDLFFMGTKSESVKYSSEEYKASKINFDTMSYSVQSGQDKRLDVNSNKTIKLNSGWVVEDLNSAFEEMLMSESIWITENSVTLPVIPIGNNFDKKTRIKDGLINYEMSFKYAFNNNNTVI